MMLEQIIAQISAAHRDGGFRYPERPWLEPLPEVLVRQPSTPAIAIGMVDDPYQQRQYPLVLTTEPEHVVVFGPPGSGTSSALHTIAEVRAAQGYRCVWLDAHDEEAVAEQLSILRESPAEQPGSGSEHTVVLVDDFEQFRDAYELSLSRSQLYQQLVELVLTGKRRQCSVVLSLIRETGLPNPLAPYFQTRLHLGQRSESGRTSVQTVWQGFHIGQESIPGRGWFDQQRVREFQLFAPVGVNES